MLTNLMFTFNLLESEKLNFIYKIYDCLMYKKNLFIPLCAYFLSKKGGITGIVFVDSTSIDVCHNKRIKRNRVFKEFGKKRQNNLVLWI